MPSIICFGFILGRKPRRLDCSECGATLKGKKNLNQHFQSVHSVPVYTCSTCAKSFKKRKNYMNHLKIHEDGAGFTCVYCDRKFKFKSYMMRHIKRAHNAKITGDVTENLIESNDNVRNSTKDDVRLFISWRESKHRDQITSAYEFAVSFPAVEKKNNCSYETFFNTLGFQSREEWDEWIEISRCLKIPVTADGSPNSFEVAVCKNGEGYEEILIAGNCTEPPLIKPQDILITTDQSEQLDILLSELALDESETDGAVKTKSVKKTTLICCPHCNEAGFRDNWFLNRHIKRMHLVPVKCDICETVFIDKYWYFIHAPNCFFVCPIEGCNQFHNKKWSRLQTHLKTHETDN